MTGALTQRTPVNPETLLKRWLSQKHFFAGVGIPGFAVCMMLYGGFRDMAIILFEARTTATISDFVVTGERRSSVKYRYEVNGRAYTGWGAPEHVPFTPPYAIGDTYEIRYSKAFPSCSTAQNPWTIFGQFLFGCGVLLWVDYMATHYGKKREPKPDPHAPTASPT